MKKVIPIASSVMGDPRATLPSVLECDSPLPRSHARM